MTIATIAPADLKLSPLNVRKSKRQHIEALADDIAAHGVIHNLVGYKQGKGYAVVAGGRRLEAIRLLEKQGRLPENFTVPVSIRPKKEAVELSLAENQSRDDMHPADAIEAYGKLAVDGLASDDIAARFGVTPAYVNRILSLARLHPDIRIALAKDEIGLEAAKAYTLTDEQECQLRLFEEFGNSAHMVRKALTGDKIATDSAIFDLVPLADYLAAGGTLTQDLFSDEGSGFADDSELLWSLVGQRLEAVREEHLADGWANVELLEREPDNFYSLNHMRPQGLRELTIDEQERLTELEREGEAIVEADPEAETWNNSDLRAINAEMQRLENARRFFTDEQKVEARVLIFLSYGGKLTVQPISLRKAGRPKRAEGAKPERFSRKLCDAIERIRLLAIREVVASKPDCALDLLLVALVEERLGSGFKSPLALRCKAAPVQVEDEFLTGATIGDVEEQADSLCGKLDRKTLFETIATMPTATKHELLAALVATAIDASCALPEAMLERLSIDIGAKWRPGAAFFARMTKGAMLDLLEEQCGKDAARNCHPLGKSDLVDETARRLQEKEWLPPMLLATNADQ